MSTQDSEPRPRTSRATLLVAVGVAALALVARMPTAVEYAFWQDEVGAARAISQPTLRGAVNRVVARESTPPAFYVLAWAVNKPLARAGLETPTRMKALRALSILFGVGCAVLTLLLARTLLPLWAAGLAGLLVAVGTPLVLHGAELRSYSLFTFACVAFALALQRVAARPTFARLGLLAGAIALGTLTHYFFVFTLAAGVAWLLLWERRRELLVRTGVAFAVGLAPLVAWSPSWLRQYEHGVFGTARPFTLARFVDLPPSLFFPQPLLIGSSQALHAAAAVVVLGSCVLLLRRPEGRLCAFCALVPLAVVGLSAAVTGERVFNTRNLLGIAPFAAIAIAGACASLPWRRLAYGAGALAGGLVLAGLAYSELALGRTPYDRIADELRAQGLGPRDPILWFGNWDGVGPVSWYLTGDLPAHTRQRIVVSQPSGRPCSAVAVVARSPLGRSWLRSHRAGLLASEEVPYFGDDLQGRRKEDLVVARLAWSPGILDPPAGGPNAFLLRLARSFAPCLERRTRD